MKVIFLQDVKGQGKKETSKKLRMDMPIIFWLKISLRKN